MTFAAGLLLGTILGTCVSYLREYPERRQRASRANCGRAADFFQQGRQRRSLNCKVC